jgi:hypothetical protein
LCLVLFGGVGGVCCVGGVVGAIVDVSAWRGWCLVLMGVGGVMAMGCTFGQGLSGLSTLSWSSMLAVAGMVLGAWLTFQWQMRSAEDLA